MTTPRALAHRIRHGLHRRRSNHWFISFPKSGRTWTKRVLERYYELGYGTSGLDFETWSPLLRTGAERLVPRLGFSHSVTRYETASELERFIGTLRNRRVILQARDPRAVVLTYFFRLCRRMRDREASAHSFSEFLRHPVLGVQRVVEFLNLWHAHRGEFKDFLLLRYEDNVSRPEIEFGRLLRFLGTPVDESILRRAVAETADTTRDIEVGGLAVLERLRAGEADVPTVEGKWREAELADWRDMLEMEDRHWLQKEVARLSPEFRYKEPSAAGL